MNPTRITTELKTQIFEGVYKNQTDELHEGIKRKLNHTTLQCCKIDDTKTKKQNESKHVSHPKKCYDSLFFTEISQMGKALQHQSKYSLVRVLDMSEKVKKCYDIVTFSIKFCTFWIRKYIDISQEKNVRYTLKPCSDIPLSDNQQSPTVNYNNYKLTTQNYQQNINICDNLTQKTEIR